MLNLAFKDIIIQKRSFILALFYIVFFMFVFQSLKQAMYPAAITAFTYILVMGAFALDDKNKTDIMMNCLPVKRSTVVTSKYLSAFLFALSGTVAYIIIRRIMLLVGVSLDIVPVNFSGILAAFLSISLMNAIYFPLLFKIGYTKAKVINMVIFFGFFFGVPAVINLVVSGADQRMENIVKIFEDNPDHVVGLLIIALALIVLFVSWLLSVKLYGKRDF